MQPQQMQQIAAALQGGAQPAPVMPANPKYAVPGMPPMGGQGVPQIMPPQGMSKPMGGQGMPQIMPPRPPMPIQAQGVPQRPQFPPMPGQQFGQRGAFAPPQFGPRR